MSVALATRALNTSARDALRDVMVRRFFVDKSFNIYGGVSGLYDYGPPGQALKKNILQQWDSYFIIEDDLHEIDASQLTLEPVLRASGHVERFSDWMVADVITGDCYRLDHLIKENLEKLQNAKDCTKENRLELEKIITKLDGFGPTELADLVGKYKMKAPGTGNELSEPREFNLMFGTSIGPTGLVRAFLRPETAQGIFVNFRRLLEANQSKLPFGAAQIGKAFRNEISPRSGLIRLREFTMAEIEYFVDPESKSQFEKFSTVRDLEVNLLSACDQMSGDCGENSSGKRTTLGDAVDSGLIDNPILGYFLGRIYLFMMRVGLDPKRLRFRQHMSNEMAHYARDCWDCECLLTFGWVECVGCADRSCFDLTQHTKATSTKLVARRQLSEGKLVTIEKCQPENSKLGREFKQDAKTISDLLKTAPNELINEWKQLSLEQGFFNLSIAVDKQVRIEKDMCAFSQEQKTIQIEEFVPNVIEPSFGIDRIVYSVLEHSFCQREADEKRNYFKFPPCVSPIKCSILALMNNAEFRPFVGQIERNLKNERVRTRLDTSGESIGKRYARTDEIGTSFSVTVDFDTIKENSVTLRDRDTTEQIRVPSSFNIN